MSGLGSLKENNLTKGLYNFLKNSKKGKRKAVLWIWRPSRRIREELVKIDNEEGVLVLGEKDKITQEYKKIKIASDAYTDDQTGHVLYHMIEGAISTFDPHEVRDNSHLEQFLIQQAYHLGISEGRTQAIKAHLSNMVTMLGVGILLITILSLYLQWVSLDTITQVLGKV